MKIGILTNYHLDRLGGAEEALDRLATHWYLAGHEVVLLASSARHDGPARLWQPAYRHVPIPRPRSTRFGLGRYVRHLEREHRSRPLSVVVASDVYWPGFVAQKFWRRRGVPYVVCSYGSDLMHGSRFLERRRCRRRMTAAMEEAGAIVAISDYMARRASEVSGRNARIRTILNGWPDEWQHGVELTAGGGAPCLVGIGRLIERKGFHVLIEAYARLRRAHPPASLVIAGDGPERARLVSRAYEFGLSPREGLPAADSPGGHLWLCGAVHDRQKQALLARATIGVCPSLWQEPQGIVLLELLSRGVPVVASRVGGIPDVVVPAYNGELVAPGDAAELAAVLDRILSQPALRERMARAAAASVAHLRWSDVAASYLELLEAVVTRSPLPLAPQRGPRIVASHGLETPSATGGEQRQLVADADAPTQYAWQ